MAMRQGLWRSAWGCGERVECLFYCGIVGVLEGAVWKTFVAALDVHASGLFHVEHRGADGAEEEAGLSIGDGD